MQIETTVGLMNVDALQRTVVLEDRPDMLALLVRYELGGVVVRQEAYPLPKQTGDDVPTTYGLLRRDALKRVVEVGDHSREIAVAEVFTLETGELVHRSVHVVLKEPSVVADAVAAQIG